MELLAQQTGDGTQAARQQCRAGATHSHIGRCPARKKSSAQPSASSSERSMTAGVGKRLVCMGSKNLRNQGAPQTRPREKARNECEREPQLKISLRLRRAHLSLSKSAVF